MQTLSRPSRQFSPSESPSSRPGLPSACRHAVRHLLRAVEQPRDVDAHQRGGHHPERRQRRVAAADRRLAGERRTRSFASRASSSSAEPGSVIAAHTPPFACRSSPCASASRASSPTSTRRRRACARRRSSLRGRGSPAGASCRGRGTVSRPNVRRITSGASDEPPIPSSTTSSTSPATESRELQQQVDVLAHAPRLVEPAEPLRLVGARPQRRVAPPDPLDDLGVRHAAASAPRFARTSSMIWSNESANFCTPSASIVSTMSS